MTDNEEREFFESMAYELDYSLIPPDQFTQSIATPEQNQLFSGLIEIVSLFLGLVARIMGTDACSLTKDIQRYTLLFLTQLHKFDRMTESDNKAKLFNTPNLLTLLNIPDNIKRFGHLRLLWELGHMGEAHIQFIKPYISQDKGNIYSGALHKYLIKQGYHDLAHGLIDMIGTTDNDEIKHLIDAAMAEIPANQGDATAGLGKSLKRNMLQSIGMSSGKEKNSIASYIKSTGKYRTTVYA